MKYGVWVVPPPSWNLPPRVQLMNNEPFYYESREEAKKQVDLCNEVARSDRTGFVYSVKEFMNFVIDRNFWLRGEGPDASTLHRKSDGKMCCLGFYGVACGLPVDDLTGKKQPNDLKGYPEWLLVQIPASFAGKGYTGCSADCGDLISYNDSEVHSDAEREAKLIELFAKHEVEVTFVG